MFGRRFLAAVAFVAACAQAQQLTITNPTSTSWWVSGSVNTLAWNCNDVSYSGYTVVVTNSNSAILTAPLALISNVPNYDCSFTVDQQQSSLAVSTSWTIELTNPLNISDVYASSQFEIKPAGSSYPVSTSSGASASGTATSSGASSSSTSSSKTGAASANYIPVGMSMAAALALGLVVA